MPKKYYDPSEFPGMPKDGILKTPAQKVAFEKWQQTHPRKPTANDKRPLIGKPTEASRKQAAKYKK